MSECNLQDVHVAKKSEETRRCDRPCDTILWSYWCIMLTFWFVYINIIIIIVFGDEIRTYMVLFYAIIFHVSNVLKFNCPRCLPFFFTHAIEMTSYSNHYFGVVTQDFHIKNFTNVNGNVNRENGCQFIRNWHKRWVWFSYWYNAGFRLDWNILFNIFNECAMCKMQGDRHQS